MLGKLSHLVDFLGKRPAENLEASSETSPQEAGAPEAGPLPLESPMLRRRLKDLFASEQWPLIKDLMFREIIIYQTHVDKDLQGALSDPRDSTASMVRYHGGRIRGAEEIKLIIERLKKNYG